MRKLVQSVSFTLEQSRFTILRFYLATIFILLSLFFINAQCVVQQSATWAGSGDGPYTSAFGNVNVSILMTTPDVNTAIINVNPGETLTVTDPTWFSEAVAGDPSLRLEFVWDTNPEGNEDDIDLASDDKGTGTMTISFSNPVQNAVLHIDRIGGAGAEVGTVGPSNSAMFTVTTPGVTLQKLAGTMDLEVSSSSFYKTFDVPNTSTLNPEATDDEMNGTAAGSISISAATPISSVSFDWTGVGVEGFGSDAIEFAISAFIDGTCLSAISLEKSGEFEDENNNGFAEVGETISYTFVVENTGTEDLTNVMISDPIVSISGGPISLSAGATNTTEFTGIYTLTAADISNEGVENSSLVTGMDPSGTSVTDVSDDPEDLTNVDPDGDMNPDDPTFIPLSICQPDAGSLSSTSAEICLEGGSAVLSATNNGDGFVPAGFQTLYVLTSGSDLIIEQTASTPSFTVTSTGLYTIHTLIYDPATLDLTIVVPGTTTGFDVNSLLSQGGGAVCASLDVAGAESLVMNCEPTDCGSLNCYGTLNISLNESCLGSLTADMASPTVNADNASDYIIEIFDHHDMKVPNNQLNENYIGQTLSFTITSLIADCPNTCWGYLLVEDKVAPVLLCLDKPLVLDCLEAIEFEGPDVDNSCGDETITVIDKQREDLRCDPDYIERIFYTYIATDESGNESEPCVQEILVERLPSITEDPDAYTFVDNFTFTTGNALDCTENALISVTGQPLFRGSPFSDLVDQNCNIFTTMVEDTVVNAPCKLMIRRAWGLFEWQCDGTDTLFMQGQIIEFIDQNNPVALNPVADFEATTIANECEAFVKLPVNIFQDSCATDLVVSVNYPNGFIEDFDNVNGEFVVLPVGEDTIVYSAIDPCGNIGVDTVIVTVEDNTPPVPICEISTAISLTFDGTATAPAIVFDNGSYDGCGLESIQVRKMNDDLCGMNQHIGFHDYLTFCCEEANSTVMVVLQVTDKNGQTNECMIEAQIQDKGTLLTEGLPDVTVSCDFIFSLDDLEIFGSIAESQEEREQIVITDPAVVFSGPSIDGFVEGSCNPEIDEEVITTELNNCGLGKITRNITVTSGDQSVVITQMITIINTDPFFVNENDILDPNDDVVWPVDVTGVTMDGMCDPSDFDPSNLPENAQAPTFTEDRCDLVAVSISEDEVFGTVGSGDACFKILRKFTIIDWCSITGPGEEPQSYSYTQTIEVSNLTKPEITRCRSVEIETFDAECEPVDITFGISARDDCRESELVYSFIIDLFDDGVYEETGIGNDITRLFPVGSHVVIWQVEDRCGNISESCTQSITVVNKKDPAIFCISGLTTDLVPWDLDGDGIPDLAKSTLHPEIVLVEGKDGVDCNGIPLVYSFSLDTTDTEIVFDCDDVGIQVITVYVTDSNGNTNFCETTIEVQDNNEVCPCQPIVAVCKNEIIVDLDVIDADGDGIDDTGQLIISSDLLYDGDPDALDCMGNPFNLSFSGDIDDTDFTIDCNSGSSLDITLFLTDSNGNVSTCVSTVIVRDTSEFCQGSAIPRSGLLVGQVQTSSSLSIPDVTINLIGLDGTIKDITDVNGTYAFDNMPKGGNYVVDPIKNSNPLNGISTLDLVFIQRHILHLQMLDNPYKIIAADVNRSETITSHDLIELRKMILGIQDGFANSESWRFVNAAYDFYNPAQPFDGIIPEKYEIINFDDPMTIDFIGLKVGDVNQDAAMNNLNELEVRNNKKFMIETANQTFSKGDIITVDLHSFDRTELIYGSQFSLSHPGLQLLDIASSTIDIDDSNFVSNIENEASVFSWSSGASKLLDQGQNFMTLVFKATKSGNLTDQLQINSDLIDNEIYVGQSFEKEQLAIVFRNDENLRFDLFQNEPNPWNISTSIRMNIPEKGDLRVNIWDSNGRRVLEQTVNVSAGQNTYYLDRSMIKNNGLYIVEIQLGTNIKHQKMLVID